MKPTPIVSTYPWADSFIECALRAIRRTHHDFGPSSLGQRFATAAPNFFALNEGLGVALADELTVCSGIYQECVNSQLFSGILVEKDIQRQVERGLRFYKIDREIPYTKNRRERVDMVICRYDPLEAKRGRAKKYEPCYVEAKRARRWKNESAKRYSTSSIRDDIRKLRAEQRVAKSGIFCHILTWDICTNQNEGPLALLTRLNDPDVELHCVRWNPVSWTQAPLSSQALPQVNRWLWIALFEVFAKRER